MIEQKSKTFAEIAGIITEHHHDQQTEDIAEVLLALNTGQLLQEFSPAVAAKIGGYPIGARVKLITGEEVISTAANNSTDPNSSMAGWKFKEHNDLHGRDQENSHPASSIVSSTGLDLDKLNDGIESISELASIPTPKNGARVYVKSYHAGLAKGGGYFTYDSSKSTINNGVTIFNGWVRDNPTTLSVYDAGVKNSTDHSDYNDHDALRRLAAIINEDTTTSYNIDFEDANIIVGKSVPNANATIQASEMPFLIDFTGRIPDGTANGAVAPKSVKIKANGARLTWRNGMKLGTFLRSDGSRYDPTMPFYPGTTSYEAQKNNVYVYPASFMIRVIQVDHIEIAGKLYLDGNANSFVKGGGYGDKDYQLGGYGIQIYRVNKYVVGGDISSNDQPSDGFYLACTAKADSFGIAKGLTALRNGRQAYSITGGWNLSFYDLVGMDSGIASLPFASAPKSNVDLEGEVAQMRNVNFYNCRFIGAGNESVVSASQDTRNVNFYDCNIEGEKSIWIDKPQFTFYGGTIKGAIQKLYGTSVDDDRVRFFNVDISDETVTNSGGWLIQAANGNPIFENCRFKLTKSAWFFNTYTSITGTPFKLKDCVIDFAFQVTALSGVFVFENLIIIDNRTDTTATMSLNFGSVYHNGVKIVSKTGISALTYSGGKLFELIPNSNIAKLFVGNPTLNYNLNVFNYVHKLGSTGAPTTATVLKSIYGDSLTGLIANTLLYNKGDTLHCTDPGAQNGISKWVCTTSGYYNNTPWVASTAYAVNAYVSANGKVYKCTVAGTSGTTAPSHTTGTAVDGSVTWEYVGSLAVFTSIGNKATGLTASSTAADIVAALKAAGLAT